MFWVPDEYANLLRESGCLDDNGDLRLKEAGPDFSPGTKAAEAVRMRHAFTDRKPLSSRLPISYQWIPATVRGTIASLIGRGKRSRLENGGTFPSWPLDLSADFLMDLSGATAKLRPTPVILSHDIDSAEGLTNLVASFLPLEEAVGTRSVNFVVPCKWELDHGLLKEVAARGHEIGVHGFDHSNRTAFCSAGRRRSRLAAGRSFADRYAASGYRAPSLLRTRNLLADLAASYRYDSSVPTSGGMFPIPQNGCGSARPFWIEGIAEIPLSMPRDGSLRFVGYSAEEIYQMWIACAQGIHRSGGVVMLLTHCERHFSGNEEMLTIYRRFLEYIAADPAFVWSTPAAILDLTSK